MHTQLLYRVSPPKMYVFCKWEVFPLVVLADADLLARKFGTSTLILTPKLRLSSAFPLLMILYDVVDSIFYRFLIILLISQRFTWFIYSHLFTLNTSSHIDLHSPFFWSEQLCFRGLRNCRLLLPFLWLQNCFLGGAPFQLIEAMNCFQRYLHTYA